MRVWWMYQCDGGTSWAVFREEDAPEREEDALCPDGHEAVTLTKMRPSDLVRVAAVPASRVADRVSGQTWHDNRYLLEVSTWDGESRLSERDFEWGEAAQHMARFRGLAPPQAWSQWDLLGLGNQLREGVRTRA